MDTKVATSKVAAVSIQLRKGEGEEAGIPVTVTGDNVWYAANCILTAWSLKAPAPRAYDKCDVKITYADNTTIPMRYDLMHHSFEAPSLDGMLHRLVAFSKRCIDEKREVYDPESMSWWVEFAETHQIGSER